MAQEVTPNPIAEPIRPSGLSVEIETSFVVPESRDTFPLTRINFTYHADDGSGRLFVADSRGKIHIYENGVRDPQPFLDVRDADGFYHNTQSGVRSFAFHPDYENPGTPGYGKFYTLATFSVESAPAGVKIFEANGDDIFVHDVITEWQVRADDPSRIDFGSRREVLRVEELLRDHNADQIMFDPNAKPGDADYGMLYFGTGDGGNFQDNPDPFDNSQDPGSPLGKILRIDPLEQANGDAYGVPGDNPFVGDADFLPEIWALGLRHPTNFSFDMGGTGQMLIADIGQANIEEINLGFPGANFGWVLREGTFATVRGDQDTLTTLPANDAEFGFTYPVLQYDRTEEAPNGLLAVTGGYVYRGSQVPELFGHYIFGDIVSGRIFHVPVSDLQQGQQTEIKELTLLDNGQPVTLLDLVGRGRTDLRFGQDENGEIYITTKQDGVVRVFASANVEPPPPPAGPDFVLAPEILENGKFGNKYDGRNDADGVVTATFENTGTDLTLSLRGYDVDFANEIRVLLNGQLLGFLRTGPNNGLNAGDSFTIAAGDQEPGTNTLTFEQNINDGYVWGITDILLSEDSNPPPPPPPPPPPGGGADFMLVLETLETDSFGNRFDGQSDADGVITATFVGTNTDLTLTLDGYDIDFANEVRVLLNGNLLGFLGTGPNNGFNAGDSFNITAAQQVAGANTLTFEQNINDGYIWGIKNILLSEDSDPPPPPPPPPGDGADFMLVLETLETDSFGNRFDGQSDADGVITATFVGTSTDLTLTLDGYDIDFANEVRVLLNGNLLGFLGTGPNNGFNAGDSFNITAAQQTAGANTLTFEQNINDGYIWGIKNILLSEDSDPPPPPPPPPPGGGGDLADLFPATRRLGDDGPNDIRGTGENELVDALGGDDTQHGVGGDDFLIIGAGSDKNYGGSGLDVAVFDGSIDDFSGVSGSRDVYLINDTNPADGDLGFDRIKAVELFAFDDALFDTRSGQSERFADSATLASRLEDLIVTGDLIT